VTRKPLRFVATPGGRLGRDDIRVPGDKSISHRAAMLGAISEGDTDIRGFLESQDCLATVAALSAMGVRFERVGAGHFIVHGVGPRGLRTPPGPLELGNSGTSMRLLAGVLAGQAFDTTLVGDASLMQRPMERVAAPLRRMGADIRTREGRAPVEIRGGRMLKGCDHELDVPSAQVKSALLLAGLVAEGRTCVREPGVSRDHTERMLESFGVAVTREGRSVSVVGPATPRAAAIRIPGDFSSAAYFIAAGLVAGSGPVTLCDVGVNPTRTAFIDILKLMGADIRLVRQAAPAGEPRADIEVRPGPLRGVAVPDALVPAAMDEFPLLFAIAALAEGDTVVTGAAELRVKESDRLAAMADGLRALGVAVEQLRDGLRIRGGPVSGGTVESRGDHRVAMSFAVLGARAAAAVTIVDVGNVATSYPGFAEAARGAGLCLAEEG
jgi:3-phosphoshikimate 1-carboxyvinyltransferase